MWPQTKFNYILNVCPPGFTMIIERLGTMSSVIKPGYFFAIPFIDTINYIDMRERNINISPQKSITKDNVQVEVSGNVYFKFGDSIKACYGCNDPLYAVQQHAQSSMRSSIGKMELDELLHNRKLLNDEIKESLLQATHNWGVEVLRYELTEIKPDPVISLSMDKQAAAERIKREKILNAEGTQLSSILIAKGDAESVIINATANAKSINITSDANSESIQRMADTLGISSQEALQFQVAQRYIHMYSDIGQKSNTIFFNQNPADITSLLAQVASVIKHTTK